MTPAALEQLITTARTMTASTGPVDPAARARRAFDLAHRARRLLEVVAETASRNRLSALPVPKGALPVRPDARFAAICCMKVIKYPVTGEAKVYAAVLDAVDAAALVSDRLYQAWLAQVRDAEPLPEPEPGISVIGGPLAPGCSWRETYANDDEDSST